MSRHALEALCEYAREDKREEIARNYEETDCCKNINTIDELYHKTCEVLSDLEFVKKELRESVNEEKSNLKNKNMILLSPTLYRHDKIFYACQHLREALACIEDTLDN